MYKLKYYSLKKEEKEKLKKDFDNTEFGIRTNTRLKRILVWGILSLLFGLLLIFSHSNIWEIISGILLLIASLVYFIGFYKIRIRNLNNYLISKKK